MLSAESSDGETTWSLGTYTSADEIGKAFKQTGDMMAPLGVFANQPNPYSTTGSVVLRRLGLFLVALFAMLIGNVFVSRGEVAYTSRHTFVHGTDDSAAFVTPAFELKGRPSSVTIEMASDVDNDWAYFALTLINDSTGISREVGKQVSYYYGRDSDGNWSEGSRKGSVRLSSVPGGRYFLRVGPEGGEPSKPPVHYTITVKRDTPSFGFYALAFFALTLPAILAWIPKGAFEGRRWAESDYAPSSGSDDDEGTTSDGESVHALGRRRAVAAGRSAVSRVVDELGGAGQDESHIGARQPGCVSFTLLHSRPHDAREVTESDHHGCDLDQRGKRGRLRRTRRRAVRGGVFCARSPHTRQAVG